MGAGRKLSKVPLRCQHDSDDDHDHDDDYANFYSVPNININIDEFDLVSRTGNTIDLSLRITLKSIRQHYFNDTIASMGQAKWHADFVSW